jgi:hypothetical protein
MNTSYTKRRDDKECHEIASLFDKNRRLCHSHCSLATHRIGFYRYKATIKGRRRVKLNPVKHRSIIANPPPF